MTVTATVLAIFPGLISKLDYIADLGVNAVWLLPFYPSPRLDDGYDISEYRDVHPDYGSLGDFRKFIREAHARGHSGDHRAYCKPYVRPASLVSARAATPNLTRHGATIMSGLIPTKNTQALASFFWTRSDQIGRGIRLPEPITGIDFIHISRI